MSLEEAIYARLAGYSPLSALVGTRIYPVQAPQGAARPYIVHARQETQNLATLGARGLHDAVDVAVMAFADTAEGARAVIGAARNALDHYSDATIAACRLVGRVQTRLEESAADPPPQSDAALFRILAVEA